MNYINKKHKDKIITVDWYSSYAEARAVLKVYRQANDGHYYLSKKPPPGFLEQILNRRNAL